MAFVSPLSSGRFWDGPSGLNQGALKRQSIARIRKYAHNSSEHRHPREMTKLRQEGARQNQSDERPESMG